MKQLNARIAALIVGGLMVLSMFGIGANALSQPAAASAANAGQTTVSAGTNTASDSASQSTQRSGANTGRNTTGGRTFAR